MHCTSEIHYSAFCLENIDKREISTTFWQQIWINFPQHKHTMVINLKKHDDIKTVLVGASLYHFHSYLLAIASVAIMYHYII
ncbi:unnamed protein product [Brugia timori]|uniref:Uncharacterized protein n=1 Tax=Brugia timori TaxID=42155 RepID=A0A3P7SYH3_9BILA|nr:unnamed protein product [Brugia timori]